MKQEEEYLLKAVNSLTRKILVIDSGYRILACNYATCKSDKKYLTMSCHKYFQDQDTPCRNCPATSVINGGEPTFRHFNNGRDNEISCLYAYPMGSRREAFIILDFDLSALDERVEKRHRSNAFLRNLILSSVDGVIAADMNGNILILNKAASEITGYTSEEAVTRLNIRNLYPEGVAYDIIKKLRSCDYGGPGKLKSCRIPALSKTGEIIPILMNASIVYEKGEEIATIGFFHDMRDTLRMEEELKRTQAQLLHAEKMASMGRLAAGVAHQLNNPLGGIKLFTQLALEDHDLPTEAREDLTRVLADAERCRKTVKELLDFARQAEPDSHPCDINHVIRQTLSILKVQPAFHDIEVITSLEESMPQIRIDVQQINHLLMNIILNAVDAMESSGILSIKTFPDLKREVAVLQVFDNGPGIPAGIVDKIFEPFFTTKEQGKGTGLGLSIAYGIVKKHKGQITVRNNPGRGARFEIELPLTGKKHDEIDTASHG